MTSDEEKKKRELFESMSPRRQQRILKKGYDKWDPFLAPKEPPFFSQQDRDRVREARLQLEEFLLSRRGEKGQEGDLSSAYIKGAQEICIGLSKGEERYQGMRDFCEWLMKTGSESSDEE
jgi:hypothetical protein